MFSVGKISSIATVDYILKINTSLKKGTSTNGACCFLPDPVFFLIKWLLGFYKQTTQSKYIFKDDCALK